MSAWLFQDTRQRAKLGDDCPWSVGWYDPEGRKKSKRVGSHSAAVKLSRKIEGQLAAGVYESRCRKSWREFRQEYEQRGLLGASVSTCEIAGTVLDHFERIAKPVRMATINNRTIAEYVAERQKERGRDCDSKVSAATINKELRHLRAVLRKARQWDYLARVPEITFLREPGKLPTYVSPEHFAAIYKGCEVARVPGNATYDASEWWRGLMVTAYMTGWRIGSLLALRRADVDLDAAVAVSRAADNKGKRDQRIPLHPIVISHLRALASMSTMIFSWDHSRRRLFDEFEAIQREAGVKPEGGKARYGFHDFRRAFATMNADKLTADALQALMQHKAYTTTQKYINMARQLDPAVQNLFVPEMPGLKAVG